MKFVPKTTPCAPFDAYIASKRPISWKKVDANLKLVLHQHLLAEQPHLCIYCQQTIPKKIQKDEPPALIHPSHVEHIRPKSTFPHRVFDQKNLAISCDGFEVDAAVRANPDFCGHKKDDLFDDALFLHPFEEPDIESFFQYEANGKIKATTKNPDKTDYTIGLLDLDNATLQRMRADYYSIVLLDEANGLDIADYLDPSQSELPKFFSMLRQLFGIA